MISLSQLVSAAEAIRGNAYAPYSGYRVGAAILDTDGKVWTGCNVENMSYGLTICAERAALCKMVSEGIRTFQSIAIVTKDAGTPCGMCLQSLLEFAGDPAAIIVVTASEAGDQSHFRLSELIPHGFKSVDLHRT